MQLKTKADIFANLAGNQNGILNSLKNKTKGQMKVSADCKQSKAPLAKLMKHSVVIERNDKF